MIKRVSDIKFSSGVSSPLFPLIYCDFKCVSHDGDGVFVQLSREDAITALMSLKNSTLTLVKMDDAIDTQEIEEYIEFFGITSVVSDFSLNEAKCKKIPLMCCEGGNFHAHTGEAIDNTSGIQVYESIFNLLCNEGDFSVWYPSFSRRTNSGFAEAIYKKDGDVIVSTAVCTAVYEDVAVVSGVFTLPSYRGKGYAGECIKSLVSRLSEKGVSEIYLWCENKNIGFYSNLGFSLCGEIYVREEF